MLKKVLVLTGAVAAMTLVAPAAHADITSGKGGIISGNQVRVPINAPINVCGNGVAVFGVAVAGCKGGAGVHGYKRHW